MSLSPVASANVFSNIEAAAINNMTAVCIFKTNWDRLGVLFSPT